ncbi:DNA cytosine methyltransferase [Pseudomonas chlororaphis]|uniref:DNA (cytosine-5-)-methyltransferase n=1 Tax=Pseudomonas chlororaphis TaxID=587753 RepID=A0AAX3G744_9PSED|nr:DNA cytosine methyltransferase [Pseudomonas chlororaphis]AZC37080.1 C-5 cytosine-specific DNA methylase family protein [Pseudomonas chlororaphis subsp. piscium]AZC43626.1 C-5 cytosine-specific DNA methylase family protein [Pseudomonas chlororaphis subsp. piscium]WDG75489.1 DNA cytosine methyltransferase [Pseudomonas chlororaphis]WDH26875.1 DNA cytosine methyltransferase [Pseudomonas chlororaphis]WDH74009.1 DNA cytosine methyltransferase [Pseudomonas chlororaphis]
MTSFSKVPFDFKTQYALGFSTQDDEIVVDYFCGAGGAGTGLEIGLDRAVNVAKNHSHNAISMHSVNHPAAVHYTTDVFDGDPDTECDGKAVGWFHMSPDCTHHSQAAGGQPRKREIRNLSWIGLKWAGKKKPRVISLENVKQILQWGPLMAKRDKATGRVVKLGGGIAAPGEVVPVHQQFLVPDPKRRGQTWAVFVTELQRLGYVVEWRVLKACDYGAPTSRERLFMIARCDGQPIVWPEPTHAKNPAKGQKKWRTAAECIDWTIPSKSIFDRPKPLAPATLRRIAKGMKKFVLDAADPFIVPIANWSGDSVQSAREPLRTVTSWPRGGSFAMASPIIAPATHQGSDRVNDPTAPLPTVTCANRGELTLISPTLIQTGYGERTGQEPRVPGLDQPLGTVVAGGVKHALTGAVLVGAGGPEYSGKPAIVDQPAGTLMSQNHRAIAAAHLVKFRFTDEGKALDEPLPTVTSGGNYQRPAGAAHAMGISTAFMAQMNGGFNATDAKSITDPMTTVTNTGSQQQLVELQLSPEVEAGALRVAAFLISYYGTENISRADEPAPTITTKDRLGLVTVTIKGTPYVIVDICLRMLQPSELYKAQGFPADYIIDRGADGKPFTKTQQVHMCGNSVSPPPMAALARANDPWRQAEQLKEAA